MDSIFIKCIPVVTLDGLITLNLFFHHNLVHTSLTSLSNQTDVDHLKTKMDTISIDH